LYATGEANFRRAKSAPSPMIEFMWRWMQRNVPVGREQRALLQADSAQFVYENGTLSGLSWLEYFTWLVGCGRWALEAIAQVVGAPLEVLERPGEGASSPEYWHASFRNLESVLDEWPGAGDGSGNSAAERARAVTRFAEHVHAFGRELEAAEVGEISEILGVRQPDLATAEAALEEFALTASPDHDAELVRYFHRWTQRQQFLIEGTGAHHESLIHISPQPLTGWN
jgi:hypothetical protein